MNWKLLAISAVALTLGATGASTARALGSPSGGSMPAVGQEHGGWEAPPREFNEFERRGFQDGITGAHRDMDNHRSPDVNNRDEYRNPQVPGNVREAYRQAFRRGYESAMAHPYTPAPPSSFVQAIQRAWDAPPAEYRDMQRRGFQDGIQGAHRDYDNNRRPDPNNRDEYRNPVNVPFMQQADYRDGFRKGYEVAMSHLMASAPPPPMRAWDAPPDGFREMQRRGFQDGIQGAHRDFDNNRRPDVDNRDEYRHPVDVPLLLQADYRDGFRKGYEIAMSHLAASAPPPPPTRAWDAPPDAFGEVQRRGFRDGVAGARSDYASQRNPDPNNRDEYRFPSIAPELRDDYRDGYRAGYRATMIHLTGRPD